MEKSELRQEVVTTFGEIQIQIDVVKALALSEGVAPEKLRTPDGAFMLAPLLVAKTQLLAAMISLAD